MATSRDAGDSQSTAAAAAAADDGASVIPSTLESDTLRKFQKKANSPLSVKR